MPRDSNKSSKRSKRTTTLIKPHTKPKPHQIEAMEVIEQTGGRCLLAMDMRLGKSFTAILWALQRLKERSPVVVVCPMGVKWTWSKETRTHAGLRSRILEGTVPYNGRRVYSRELVWVINYDILTNWIPFLRGLDPKLVIIDESQYIKSRQSQRTKAVRRLCKGVPHVLALSGTPLVNRPAELFPTLNLLWRDEFPNYNRFAERYCGRRELPFGGWDDSGATNLPELHRRLKELGMVRMRRADVLTRSPGRQEEIVLVDIHDPNKEYEKARDGYVHWLRDFRNVYATKMQERSQLNSIKELVGRLKLPAVFHWIDDWLESNPGEKIIVFGWHRNTVEAIHKRYPGLSVMVHGSVRGRRRQAAYDTFTKSPRVRILSGNIQAAGTGWPGHAASAVAVVEFPWTPGDLAQATARPEGLMQKKKVHCYYLTARGTIDETLIRILEKKAKVLAATLDGRRRREDFDVYNKVSEALKLESRRGGGR